MKDLRLQVMWTRLMSIVEEQALTLVRIAFSTSVREAGDLSAGVFDAQGRMLCQAVTGTPGHVNTMAAAVGNFIDSIGKAEMFEDDAYVTNDPWKGTGHLHDFTVVTPVFRNNNLIGFFACTAHVVDIGGTGFGPDSKDVYEEGLLIPIMRLVERGRLNQNLLAIIKHNVRETDQVIGDLHSLVACNRTGAERLHQTLDEFELGGLEEIAAFIFDRTRSATLASIEALPHGSYSNTMQVDGYNDTLNLCVTLTSSASGIHANFAGSSPACLYGINVPLVYARAYLTYAMLVVFAPGMPNNHASLEPFTVSAPTNCILNAQHPDPVSVRHVIGHFVTDLCLGAIAQALPDLIPAEGSGALWNFHVSARTCDPTNQLPPREILMFNSGGTGARPHLDGLNATAFPSGVRTMSVEATEQSGPIIIWRKELRPDSGGDGLHRGGLGQVIELGPADGYYFDFNCMFDRVSNPARGRQGGDDGAPGTVMLDNGTKLNAKGKQRIPGGRKLVLELPGGGGFGNPLLRDPSDITNDKTQGYIE